MKSKPKTLGQVCCEAFAEAKGTVRKAWWSRSARAVIREYERRQWRPVSVRPKKNRFVFVTDGNDVAIIYYTGFFCPSVTHWRTKLEYPKSA